MELGMDSAAGLGRKVWSVQVDTVGSQTFSIKYISSILPSFAGGGRKIKKDAFEYQFWYLGQDHI